MDKAEIEKTRNFIKNNLAQESRITDRFFKEVNSAGMQTESFIQNLSEDLNIRNRYTQINWETTTEPG